MRLSSDPSSGTGSKQWIFLYESSPSRDYVLTRFGEQAEAQFQGAQWLSFGEVTNHRPQEALFQKLITADVIVVAAAATGDFTDEFKSWINGWVARRNDCEGTLVGLFHERKAVDSASRKEIYLRQAAHLAGLDYLSQLPLQTTRTVPDSLDTFSQRAGQMTSVLDSILKTRPAPTLPRRH